MGILLAVEPVEIICGMRLRDFEQKEIFEPLGMPNSVRDRKSSWRISDKVWWYELPGTDPKHIARFGANAE